jgi:LysR family hydrogen peroxide-inducible transcriptional activator
LERELDARILDREAGKNVVFTALGHDLMRTARGAMAALPREHRLAVRARVPVAALARERLLLLEDGHYSTVPAGEVMQI